MKYVYMKVTVTRKNEKFNKETLACQIKMARRLGWRDLEKIKKNMCKTF